MKVRLSLARGYHQGSSNNYSIGGGRGSPTTLESTGLKVPPKSDEGTQTAPEEGRDRTEQEKPVPTPKEYEDRAWRWDERIQDYVAEESKHRET